MIQLFKLGFKIGFFLLLFFVVGLSLRFCFYATFWSGKFLVLNDVISINSFVVSAVFILRILLVISVYLYMRKVWNYKWWKAGLITPLIDVFFIFLIPFVLFMQKLFKALVILFGEEGKEMELEKFRKIDIMGQIKTELENIYLNEDITEIGTELMVGLLFYIVVVFCSVMYCKKKIRKADFGFAS